MVTLKQQKSDSIFGSEGATKNYVKSKINAIPEPDPPAADTITGTGTTNYFTKSASAYVITGNTGLSQGLPRTDDRATIGQYNVFDGNTTILECAPCSGAPPCIPCTPPSCPSVVCLFDLGHTAYLPLVPNYIFKARESTTENDVSIEITLPALADFSGQRGTEFYFICLAYVAHTTAADAWVDLYSPSDSGNPTELINGRDQTASPLRLVTDKIADTYSTTSMWRVCYTGEDDIGWAIGSMSPAAPHSHPS